VVTVKMAVFWVVPFHSHGSHWFALCCSPCPLFLASLTVFCHGLLSYALKFEMIDSSKILVLIDQTTQCHRPEDNNLYMKFA
jgi:hypothetical protein